MKKIMISIILAVVMVAGLLPGFTITAHASAPSDVGVTGSGTANDPYIIMTADQFIYLVSNTGTIAGFYSSSYKLGADIDLSGRDACIIESTLFHDFSGTFDGNGHTISNLVSTDLNCEGMGLFGYVGTKGVIKNLGLVSCNINAKGSWSAKVGTLVGLNKGTVRNCYSTGTVSSTNTHKVMLGGLIGYNEGTVENCYTTDTISIDNVDPDHKVGSLVGKNAGTIKNCYYLQGNNPYNNKDVGFSESWSTASNNVAFTSSNGGTLTSSSNVGGSSYSTLLSGLNADVLRADLYTWKAGAEYPVFDKLCVLPPNIATVTVYKDDVPWTEAGTPVIKLSTDQKSLTGAISGTLVDGVYAFDFDKTKIYYVWQVGPNAYTNGVVLDGFTNSGVYYYTVTFKSDDGNTTLNTQTGRSGYNAVYGGTTPTKPSDAQYSYAFSKWVTTAGGTTGATFNNITTQTAVYASFTPTLRSYAITWKKDDTTTIDTTTLAYGSIPSHADPTKTGYKFSGWKPAIGSVTGDAIYTANWTADSYNITYQLNGGNVSAANPESYTSDSTAITLNNPTRDGYSFVGWSGTDLTGNTNQSVTIAPNSTGAKAYTANWKANTPTAPDASVVTAKTSTTLTISTAVGYEYSLDGTSWFGGTNGSYTFTSLNPGQSYNLVCRKSAVTTEGSVSAASDLSPALSVTIKNAAPGAPTLAFAAITENSVKITAVDGAEYSKDNGVNWQDSNEFTGLESATKYNFAIRIKETGQTIAGIKASKEEYTLLPTVAAAGASYDNMTQAVVKDEMVIEAALKATAITAVNDNSVEVTINKVSYTDAVAGTSAKPAGTNGSYTFTVTLSKNGQTDKTTEKTIVISATAFTGVSDVDAVAAAKTAIKDSTVTVAFGADQTAKTAAVQSYVDGLLTGDSTGVTATVTFNSETGKYDVAIAKGSIEDSTTITMTITEDADPDIATVNHAKNAAENAIYVDMLQVVATDETVIQDALKDTAKSAVNNDTVNVTVTKESYTAPIAGTSADPAATNGSYVFKITVSKGAQTLFTSQKTIVIVATPYAEIPTYQIIGIVQDGTSSSVQNATVKLMRGQSQVGLSAQTDADGKFTIENVANGTYNLVVSKNGITVTTLVVVNNANNTLESAIILPSGKTNSVVEVKPSTPAIVVGELDKQFQQTTTEPDKGVTSMDHDVVTNGGSVEIKLIAEKKDNTATNATDISATATSDGKTVGILVDLSVLKTVKDSSGDEISSQSAILKELPSLIEVLIPLPTSLQGKSNYVVYRYHGTEVNTIITEANSEGERIELINNGTTIKLTVKKFSTYAIAYTTPTGGGSGSHKSSSVETQTITVESSEGGKITISTDKNTATITPDEGYAIADVLVDGKSAGAAEKYTFKDSNTHKITAVFVKKSALPYYNQEDQKIYIGFSAVTGNLYKYIVPTGVNVKYKENPKTFTDNTIAWAKLSIDFVTEREIFLGIDSDKFGPNESMTRAMFVTAIGRLYERSYGSISGNGSVSGTSTFSDVNTNDYFAKYVAWANENGIIKGIGENKFVPNEKITREQMAVIMLNFATYLKKTEATGSSLAYSDSASLSTWAINGAKYCQETNVITGREGGSFMPKGKATRAEVAAVIERFVKNIVK